MKNTFPGKDILSMAKICVLLALMAIFLPACSRSIPQDYPRQTSIALKNPRDTPLGKAFIDLENSHREKSGYYLLSDGVDAFVARLRLMDVAQQTIDIQYYIYRFDIAGQMFARQMLAAADRGVRVRLLLDDMEIDGNDRKFAMLDAHPNIQVRFFNPFAGRSGFSRIWSFLIDFKRVNQRMHNKIFAVDNQVAIVGGRNIADEYFSVEPNQYFADLDLLAAGPVVRKASASFDEFWNFELAVPVDVLVEKKITREELQTLRDELDAVWAKHETHEFSKRLRKSDLNERIKNQTLPLIWAPGKVVYDKPTQIIAPGKEDKLTLVGSYFEPHLDYTDEEFLLISPYLIPGENGMRLFRRLRQRGVRFGILTNSLAATDVAVVYGAYADYRKPILDMGIELFELKPSAATAVDDGRHSTSVGATLHAKTMVFDRAEIFVGSMNLDPRSVRLNTELGFIVTSPPLASQIADLFASMTSPQKSLKLTLEDGDLLWSTKEKGAEARYHRSPYVSIWRLWWSNMAELIVPDSLL